MARRDRVQISLFPFMSVLACTIGALIVVLAVISLAAVGASGAAAPSTGEDERPDPVAQARRLAASAALAEAEALWRRVDREAAARGLEQGMSAASLLARLEGRRSRLERARELEALADQRARVQEEREEIETTIDVLESRRETLPILIDPTGLSRALEPFFVECDAEGVTAYRARDDLQYFIPREELEASVDFARYLRRVRAIPGSLLVLLIRPDGLATAAEARALARAQGVRVARLPLPGSGALDWSLLRRAEGAG